MMVEEKTVIGPFFLHQTVTDFPIKQSRKEKGANEKKKQKEAVFGYQANG